MIQESGEMYLETVLVLSRRQNSVRSVDVSEYMGYSKPSVSRAVGVLRERGYLHMEKDGSLVLTETGREVAEKIYARHTLLTEVLVCLGVDSETAAKDACKIEHDISDATFEAIIAHREKFTGNGVQKKQE